MVRAVLFDFYGTLARASSWGAPYEDILAGYGLALPDEVRRRLRAEVFDGQDHREHSRSQRSYEAWEMARLRRLTLACGLRHPAASGELDTDAIVANLHRASKDFTMEAYPEAPAVLAAIRASGRMVAVCSNWGWDLDRAMEQAGLRPLVDVMVTSAQAGTRKPHPQIFQHTLARCGVTPTEALFVGDTWHPDVEGPLAVGMRAVHVWRGSPDTNGAGGVETNGVLPRLPPGVVRVDDLTPVVNLALS